MTSLPTPMTATFTYTDATFVSGPARHINWGHVSWPGRQLTRMVVSSTAVMPDDIGTNLHIGDGTQINASVWGQNISPGQTSSDSGAISITIPSDTTFFYFQTVSGNGFSPAQTFNQTVSLTFSDANPPVCAYGAQPNPDATVYTVITEILVDAVVAALGMGPLGIVALDTMIGSPIAFPICGNVPSMPAALTDADFLDGTGLPNPMSLGKWKDHFVYGVWLFYCECKPAPSGSPAPVNPPVPVLPPRLQPGPQPAPPCTNTDICATLNRITNILTTINVTIQNSSYAMPEPAYTWGQLYANLTGNGEIAVSGILGAFVSLPVLPPRVGGAIGNPNTLFDVGHIAFGTPDGWFPRVPITSNPWLILPQHMANVSKLGYSIPQDCAVDIHLVVPVPLQLAAVAGT